MNFHILIFNFVSVDQTPLPKENEQYFSVLYLLVAALGERTESVLPQIYPY